MEKGEENNSPKCEKGSPVAQQFPLPSPYLSTSLQTGHVLHMWTSQQPFMPPYTMPYPIIYPHGIVYAHPAVPLAAVNPSIELFPKPSEEIDQSSAKKLKGLNGLAVPIDNDKAEVNAEGSIHGESQSDAIVASADEINGDLRGDDMPGGKVISALVSRCMEDTKSVSGQPLTSLNRNPEMSPACNAARLPFDMLLQNEWQLKRERRKQANRESARRSRLRKQAEFEEVMRRYESMKMDNNNLKSELYKLKDDMEKVRVENATLMAKLKITQLEQPEETALNLPQVKLEILTFD